MSSMTFVIRTGNFYGSDGALLGTGWTGHDTAATQGRNNPDATNMRGIGPLPVGRYSVGDPHDSPHLGPFAMELIPDPGNKMFGRSGFFIHGASITDPEDSSDGCIIQSRPVREAIDDDDSDQLAVVADEADHLKGT